MPTVKFAAYFPGFKDQDLIGKPVFCEGRVIGKVTAIAGENIIFTTPKENFIRLMNRNNGASNISIESVDRQIKVFADWYESVGFGIEEAVFAYVPA